jgi:hypothetical protein
VKGWSLCCALVGTALCALGCMEAGGLQAGSPLGTSASGGASGSPLTSTGGLSAPTNSGAGGVAGSPPASSAVPDAPVEGSSCGPTCLASDANTIAHWTFDSINNGTVPDQSGNGFNGTIFGGPALTNASCGSAIALSGSGQYLDVQNWNRLIGYSKVTYDVLFKINSLRDDGTAGGDMVAELINDSHWYPIGGTVVRVRNRVLQLAIATTTGWQYVTDVVPVSFGEWHHVFASFDTRTSTMSVQLDCHVPVSTTYSGTFVPSYVDYTRIGSCVVDPPSRFLDGAIDAILVRGWR